MHGPGHLRTVLNDLAAWLQEHEWPSLAEMRGNMSPKCPITVPTVSAAG